MESPAITGVICGQECGSEDLAPIHDRTAPRHPREHHVCRACQAGVKVTHCIG
jgi:hypothetical protein